MKKLIKERNPKADAEVISHRWARETAAEYIDLCRGYMRSCMLSPDPVERGKYYDSAMEALSKLVVPLEMVGMLGDQEILLTLWFGPEIAEAVEVVEDKEE